MDTDVKRKKIADRFFEKNSATILYEPIKVSMGRFNNPGNCAENCRQALETGDAGKIAEVVQVTRKGLIRLHFIEKTNGHHGIEVYVDNTLGYLSKDMDYYLIKEYTLEDLKDVNMFEFLRKRQQDLLHELFTEEELKEIDVKPNEL